MRPDPTGLRIQHRRTLREAGDYAAVAASLAKETGAEARKAYYERLARYLSVAGVPDYSGLVASAKGEIELSETLRLACVRDACRRQLVFHAFEFVLPPPKTEALLRRWQALLVEGLEQVFLLSGQGGSLVLPFERVLSALVALLESLAIDPANQSMRVRVATTLGPSIAGITGLGMMASAAIKLASRPVATEPTITPGSAGVEWLSQHEAFVRSAFEWLKGEEPLVKGGRSYPRS